MIHRKPVPLYIPSPNSPVPPMTFSPVHHQEQEEQVEVHDEDYPPPLPEGWDTIMQDAMEASLDTVHIKRRLTRPPGIAPTPSLVHSRQCAESRFRAALASDPYPIAFSKASRVSSSYAAQGQPPSCLRRPEESIY
ncbi:hypothetical protein ONZ45_g3685 [Pleurotus djamor]|nr:hypothetical protein ONZ45_g3685 [Pleurotus djamor]